MNYITFFAKFISLAFSYTTEIQGDVLQMLDSRNDSGQPQSPHSLPQARQQNTQPPPPVADFDDDIPF